MFVTPPRVNTGLLLPGEATLVVTAVAWLFGLTGVLTTLVMVYAFGGAVLSASAPASTPTLLIGIGLGTLVGVGYCLTAIWLHEGRRRGAYLAMAVESLSLLSRLTGVERPSAISVAFSVAMLVGLAFAWPHLSSRGRTIDPPITFVPRKRR